MANGFHKTESHQHFVAVESYLQPQDGTLAFSTTVPSHVLALTEDLIDGRVVGVVLQQGSGKTSEFGDPLWESRLVEQVDQVGSLLGQVLLVVGLHQGLPIDSGHGLKSVTMMVLVIVIGDARRSHTQHHTTHGQHSDVRALHGRS